MKKLITASAFMNKLPIPALLLVLSSTALAEGLFTNESIPQYLQVGSHAPAAPVATPLVYGTKNVPLAVKADGNFKIEALTLRVTGSSTHSEAELVAVAGFKPGEELTFSDLRAKAQLIESFLKTQGYLLASAHLPVQTIRRGVVTLVVVEGKYEKILVKNTSSLKNSVIDRLLQELKKGDVVAIPALERSLKLLADLPGTLIKSTLVPGETTGTSSLMVEVSPGKRVTGDVEYSNPGNEFTGKNKIGGTVNINNPLGLGDVLKLRVTTTLEGLNNSQISYEAQAGEARAGAELSALTYKIDFEGLLLKGDANIASVYTSFPIIRSVDNNLYAKVSFNSKSFSNLEGLGGNRKVQVLMASLSGDYRDSLGGGGLTKYSFDINAGALRSKTSSTLESDAKEGGYAKLGFSIKRLQQITRGITASAAIRGQLASTNLDSSEQLAIGGAEGVRAISESRAFGDQGLVVNLEGVFELPRLERYLAGRLQIIGFYDIGSITFRKNPQPGTVNSQTLSGLGLGFRWFTDTGYSLNVAYAKEIGNLSKSAASSKSGRLLIKAARTY
jgi:hemolysin activation/secretion protein